MCVCVCVWGGGGGGGGGGGDRKGERGGREEGREGKLGEEKTSQDVPNSWTYMHLMINAGYSLSVYLGIAIQ